MTIMPHNINNVLRTYSHNFKLGKVVSGAGNSGDSVKKSGLDKVEISIEAREKFADMQTGESEFTPDLQADEIQSKVS